MNDLKKYFSYNTNMIILMGICVIIFGNQYVSPLFKSYSDVCSQISDLKPNIKKIEASIKAKKRAGMLVSNKEKPPVSIYESPFKGTSVETACVDLIDELIYKLQASKNKIVEISYSKVTDAEKSTKSYKELEINLRLNSDYLSFQKFIKEIATWKYLAAIKKIEITPAELKGSLLDIKTVVTLYVKN